MRGENTAEVPCNITQNNILIIPFSHSFATIWKTLKLCKWSCPPIAGTENDRDNMNLLIFMELQGTTHLNFITLIRSKEIRANQEKNDRGFVKGLTNSL